MCESRPGRSLPLDGIPQRPRARRFRCRMELEKILAQAEPFRRMEYPSHGPTNPASRDLSAESNQDEIDRRHGKGLPPGIPRGSLRSIGAGCRTRAAGASGVAIRSLRPPIRPATLDFGSGVIRLRFAAEVACPARARAASPPHG